MGNFFAENKARRAELGIADRVGSDKKRMRDQFAAARAGVPGSAPLGEFLSSKNTRYARDVIGWDKAQGLRTAAEAADVGAVSPDGKGGNKWDRRYNYSTGEMEWIEKDPANFWRANKDELIQMGAMTVGGLLLGPGGMMLGKSLADTGTGIYESRKARRAYKDQKREFEYNQAMEAAAEDAARRANMGNLFRSGGEGVIEYATKDLAGKKRDQYVRKPYQEG